LVKRITGEVAPPMPLSRPALSAGEIAAIRRWIDEGARETITSAAAKPKWEAPLALERPAAPAVVWRDWTTPVDRFVAMYLSQHGGSEPELIGDAAFARRAYLDIWGLLPPPDDLHAFVGDRPRQATRTRPASPCDNDKYASIGSRSGTICCGTMRASLLSETSSRKSISPWLLSALTTNTPYNRFVSSS